MGRQRTIVALHDEGVMDWKLRETLSRNALVRAAQEMGARVITPAQGTYSTPPPGLTADPEDLQ
jgi:hypothetical protein